MRTLGIISKSKFAVYALRWQLLSPIIFVIIGLCDKLGDFWAVMVANFAGACICFYVDKFIFRMNEKPTVITTTDRSFL